ncbi:MAG TPA: DUF4129 domain-containing protein [Accumulibacter sp.]|uniref:DUF4129 domain-containing protein n=1 Tax=Accumulibacter sp. TaxID=2053492 RepID=UPI002BE89318|nr:DUF4129 domain-containing protein [Accumulibacter sp.]HNN83889.1 DUF4129 domain-containing protein [Accumulibacter sp.]
MRLEQIALHLRRRTPWEALDLGHAMFRTWSWPAYRAWLLTYWLAGLCILALLWPWPQYAGLVLWWLKPLFDRVLLHVFSRSLFAADDHLRDLLGELPRLLRGPGVLSGLSLRRLSLARSFLLPVWQLEEQQGSAARTRFRLLSRHYRGYAAWLTFFCANMSSLLTFSLLIVLAALAPGDSSAVAIEQWFGNDLSRSQYLIGNLVYMLAESIVEPLYVASGFSLYLNRRSELEAWDIELGLRRLAERTAPSKAEKPLSGQVGALLALLVLSSAAVWPTPGLAAEDARPTAGETVVQCPAPDDDSAADDDTDAAVDRVPASGHAAPEKQTAARQSIDAVLADPVFGQVREDWRWRWRADPAAPSDTGSPGLRALVAVLEQIAQLVRSLLPFAAGVALAVLIYVLVRYRPQRPSTARAAGPAAPLGFELDPATLPADPAAAARSALAAGKPSLALSLLYRGAIVALSQRHGVSFLAADTEDDCLRRIAGRLDGNGEHFFGEIVEAWRRIAYAQQLPSADQVERLIGGWQASFGRHRGSP